MDDLSVIGFYVWSDLIMEEFYATYESLTEAELFAGRGFMQVVDCSNELMQ
jgi:hypothetical protein